jgi:hypothetical protein
MIGLPDNATSRLLHCTQQNPEFIVWNFALGISVCTPTSRPRVTARSRHSHHGPTAAEGDGHLIMQPLATPSQQSASQSWFGALEPATTAATLRPDPLERLAPEGSCRVTGGFLYKLGGVSYTIRILMYPACILHVSCMYSSRYIKIHQDTTRYICICHFGHQRKCILPRDMYPSLRYIQDTFKIHCILTLRYMTHKIHSP